MICILKLLLLSLLLSPFPPEAVADMVRQSVPMPETMPWNASDCACPLDYVEKKLPTQCGQANRLLYWLLYTRTDKLLLVAYEGDDGTNGHTLVWMDGKEYDAFLSTDEWRNHTTGRKRFVKPSRVQPLFDGCSLYETVGTWRDD